MGAALALCSVLLVSGAQLLLRWAMMNLPDAAAMVNALSSGSAAALALVGGLAAYVVSLCFWFLALRRIALSKACPLLSLSYVLVWGGALFLPYFQEVFHWGKLAGVALILAGLLLICWPGETPTAREREENADG